MWHDRKKKTRRQCDDELLRMATHIPATDSHERKKKHVNKSNNINDDFFAICESFIHMKKYESINA